MTKRRKKVNTENFKTIDKFFIPKQELKVKKTQKSNLKNSIDEIANLIEENIENNPQNNDSQQKIKDRETKVVFTMADDSYYNEMSEQIEDLRKENGLEDDNDF